MQSEFAIIVFKLMQRLHQRNQPATIGVQMKTVSLSGVYKVEHKWGLPETTVYHWPPANMELELDTVKRCYNLGGDSVVVTWESKIRRWKSYYMRHPKKEFGMA